MQGHTLVGTPLRLLRNSRCDHYVIDKIIMQFLMLHNSEKNEIGERFGRGINEPEPTA